jgi:hypothetical protein
MYTHTQHPPRRAPAAPCCFLLLGLRGAAVPPAGPPLRAPIFAPRSAVACPLTGAARVPGEPPPRGPREARPRLPPARPPARQILEGHAPRTWLARFESTLPPHAAREPPGGAARLPPDRRCCRASARTPLPPRGSPSPAMPRPRAAPAAEAGPRHCSRSRVNLCCRQNASSRGGGVWGGWRGVGRGACLGWGARVGGRAGERQGSTPRHRAALPFRRRTAAGHKRDAGGFVPPHTDDHGARRAIKCAARWAASGKPPAGRGPGPLRRPWRCWCCAWRPPRPLMRCGGRPPHRAAARGWRRARARAARRAPLRGPSRPRRPAAAPPAHAALRRPARAGRLLVQRDRARAAGAALRLCDRKLQLRCARAPARAPARGPNPGAARRGRCCRRRRPRRCSTPGAAAPPPSPAPTPRPPLPHPAESLVPYARWYHCGVGQRNVALRGAYVVRGRGARRGGWGMRSGGWIWRCSSWGMQVQAAPPHPRQALPRPALGLCVRVAPRAASPHLTPPPPAAARRGAAAAVLLPAGRHRRVLLLTHHGARQPVHPKDAPALRGRCALRRPRRRRRRRCSGCTCSCSCRGVRFTP